ncbi:hypothetical protein HHK36_011733 [Tetracentron sinense]|uniref:Uncharacterized protein n=1 Tax=Tetracentron sinense TaxID=13715 RepID=A0A834Z8X5_TETSI|nr:hypothetical protein HHK36_011733 [Tetracentron sinense]
MTNSLRSPLLNFNDEEHKKASSQQEFSQGGWRSAIFIIGVEVAERFAYYGMSGNLITYLTNVLHQSTATAAKNVNTWSGVSSLLPLLGAFIADTYLGRFKTILFASLIYDVGLVMLVISVSVIPLRFRYVTFFFSLYLVAVGEGGHRPCVQTFGADQFDEDKKAKSSFFNWWYFGICGGAAAAMFIVIYIQDNVGWAVGFGIPAVAMVLALVLFLLGQRLYRRQVPSGSPLTRVAQVFVAACRKRRLTVSQDGHGECWDGEGMGVQPSGRTLTHTNQFNMTNSLRSPLLNFNDEEHKKASSQQEFSQGGWRSAIFIIGVEVAERFAYYGMSGNLITYLTNVLHQSTATAAKNVNTWSGVSTLLPLLGAFIADTYLGRFKTILFASLIYDVGLVMLVISVSVIPLRFRYVTFFFSLYMVAVGEGGHRPCVQTFGADQFDEDKKAKSSFFNWWYFGICGGAAAAMFIVIYIQDNVGWAVGFGIPAVAMVLALVLFLLGQRLYRRQIPSGSPLTRVAQVFVAACRKRRLTVSQDGHGECWDGEGMGVQPSGRTLTHTNQFKFLDKSTFSDDLDASSTTINNWRLCSISQVEEAKALLRLIPIWLSCLMYAILFAQSGTFFTKQGSTMVTKIGSHFSIPPASLQVFIGIVVVIIVPIYDRILVPITRNITGLPSGITMLQRIGMGIFFSTVTMIVAALVEARRLSIAKEYGLLDQPKATVPMSVWWLLPQYVIAGVSDVFAIVRLQELFYDQIPKEMRSIGAAAYLSVLGVGSLLSSAVISIVQLISTRCGDEWLVDNLNRAHLNYYYWLLAGLNTLALCVYVVVARCFVYKKIDGIIST